MRLSINIVTAIICCTIALSSCKNSSSDAMPYVDTSTEMVIAVYEHVDSITGDTTWVPFDSLYISERPVGGSDCKRTFSDSLNSGNDPLWYVPLESLDINYKPLCEIRKIYGMPLYQQTDTLMFGVSLNLDGMTQDDYDWYCDRFSDYPYSVIHKLVWKVDDDHDLELYFMDNANKDTVAVDGWIQINWFE